MKALFVRFRPWFENPRHPLQLALLAFLLTSPALTAGWIIDDYYHRAALQALPDLPELARSPAEMFAFVGDRWTMPSAALPWWSDAQLRLAFFRPVTGLTHWLDLRLWPDSAPLMHAQSLLWLALLVFLAARLYRQLSPFAPTVPLGVAGLAGLLFALDHGHAVPAAWIANRNALLAAAFSLAALTSYDRHRREAWAPGAWWTPLLLLAGVLSGEGAVGCGAYLLAYALLLDQGPLRSRLWALAPSTLVGVVWWLTYKWMGYGASHSTVYIDPGTQPDRFLGALLERIPVLLWGQWSFPPADVYNALSQQAAAWALGGAVAFTVLLLWLLTPLLKESALARFYGAGMLLSMVPACATFPAMRLLVLPSFGAMGLMALFLCRTFGRRSRHVRREAAFFFLGVHIFFAPVSRW